MWKPSVLMVLVVLLAAPAMAASLYRELPAAWSGRTALVEGREFKFLVDPAKVAPALDEAFREIWAKARGVAESLGIRVTAREKQPFALYPAVKTYVDTADMQLWKAGYLIRLTADDKKGSPSPMVRVMVKRINQPPQAILAGRMEASGEAHKVRCGIEDNIGINADGTLSSYLEQGLSFQVGRTALGEMKLADFGRFAPFLLKLGIAPTVRLVPRRVFAILCRPGFIALPGLEKPAPVSMEAWAHTEGAAPFVYDYSYGYDGDFDRMGATHAAAEDFLSALYRDLGPSIGFGDAARWGGSKVRMFLQQPRH